jgi:hypothetical protein
MRSISPTLNVLLFYESVHLRQFNKPCPYKMFGKIDPLYYQFIKLKRLKLITCNRFSLIKILG